MEDHPASDGHTRGRGQGDERIFWSQSIPTSKILLTDDLLLYSSGDNVYAKDSNGNVCEILLPDDESIQEVQVFGNGLVIIVCERDFYEYSYYYLCYEDIRPEGFEPDNRSFESDLMTIHDYDLPE